MDIEHRMRPAPNRFQPAQEQLQAKTRAGDAEMLLARIELGRGNRVHLGHLLRQRST
jgi:hypothetical protein